MSLSGSRATSQGSMQVKAASPSHESSSCVTAQDISRETLLVSERDCAECRDHQCWTIDVYTSQQVHYRAPSLTTLHALSEPLSHACRPRKSAC